MTERKYIPEIGKRVTLKEFGAHHRNGIDQVWAHLKVLEVNGDQVKVDILNGSEQIGKQVTVPLSDIAPPIGWQPRYTITVAPDKVDAVLGWMKRGIVCRLSHDLNPNYMPMVYQPMDNAGQPDWRFPEVTDTVPPEDCDRVFKIVKVETEEINFVHDPACKYCNGSGRRSIAQVAAARGETINQLHDAIIANNDQFFGNYDPIAGDFDCTCRFGGFAHLAKKQRDALKAEWKKDGWNTEYDGVGQNGVWLRTRDTVVKDWAE